MYLLDSDPRDLLLSLSLSRSRDDLRRSRDRDRRLRSRDRDRRLRSRERERRSRPLSRSRSRRYWERESPGERDLLRFSRLMIGAINSEKF